MLSVRDVGIGGRLRRAVHSVEPRLAMIRSARSKDDGAVSPSGINYIERDVGCCEIGNEVRKSRMSPKCKFIHLLATHSFVAESDTSRIQYRWNEKTDYGG